MKNISTGLIKNMNKYCLLYSFCCFFLLLSQNVWGAAPTDPEQLRDRLEASVKQASKTGEKTAAWQMEREHLLEEIQDLELKAAWAEFQLGKTEKWLATERSNVETLTENLARAATTREQLEPFLEVLYGNLEDHVLADLPFLKEERNRRLAYIRSTLDSPEASLSDKLGRLLEAMQVEVDYGYNVEATQELVQTSKGESVQATVLRLGRLSLFRLLGDNSHLERYDREKKLWQKLPDSSIFEVEKAIEIARKKRVSTLLFLPVGSVSALSQAPRSETLDNQKVGERQ